MVGTIAGGGGAWAGAATAALLGVRNAFYGLELSADPRPAGRASRVGAHLVIDESAAMGVAQPTPELGRLGFWATGVAVFVGWNLMTLVGAVGASALDDPGVLGLDVAGPAAFVALLAPRLTGREPWAVALVAAVALAARLVPAGVPVLVAAAVAIVAGLRARGTDARSGHRLPRERGRDRRCGRRSSSGRPPATPSSWPGCRCPSGSWPTPGCGGWPPCCPSPCSRPYRPPGGHRREGDRPRRPPVRAGRGRRGPVASGPVPGGRRRPAPPPPWCAVLT